MGEWLNCGTSLWNKFQKRNKLLIHRTTWMDPKGIMLSEEKKANPKSYILCDSIYIVFLNYKDVNRLVMTGNRDLVRVGWM